MPCLEKWSFMLKTRHQWLKSVLFDTGAIAIGTDSHDWMYDDDEYKAMYAAALSANIQLVKTDGSVIDWTVIEGLTQNGMLSQQFSGARLQAIWLAHLWLRGETGQSGCIR